MSSKQLFSYMRACEQFTFWWDEDYEKKVYTVMVNNSTNIKKANNHHPP